MRRKLSFRPPAVAARGCPLSAGPTLFLFLALCATAGIGPGLGSFQGLAQAQPTLQTPFASGAGYDEDSGGFVGDDPNRRGLKQNALIVNGIDAPNDRFPYMAALLDHKDNPICGGVLIDPQWVLTAAHCLYQKSGKSGLGLNPQVKIGALNISEPVGKGNVQVRVGTGHLHPKWNGILRGGNDIALIKLREQVINATTIEMPVRETIFRDDDNLVALGWGQQGNGSVRSEILQWGNLGYVSKQKCNKPGYWNGKVVDEVMCAKGKKQAVCHGDSGGPLILAHSPVGDTMKGSPDIDVLVGITSFGDKNPCDQNNILASLQKPAVFTRITEYLDWIEDTQKLDADDNDDDVCDSQDCLKSLISPGVCLGIDVDDDDDDDDVDV